MDKPVVQSKTVSELVLTHAQLIAAIRETYPEIGRVVVADATYGCGRMQAIKLTWSELSGATITVNGDEKIVTCQVLSYEDIVEIATGSRAPTLSVTFQFGSSGGSLSRGQTIVVCPGLRINAYDTGNA